jgi:hypothetical protein
MGSAVREKSAKATLSLVYPKHWNRPEDLLGFIELRPFTAAWHQLKLTDDDLQAVQIFIMTNPKFAPVIEGTGGLRKARFSPARERRGKSGGYRVCYVYFEDAAIVLLVLVYPKSEKDNLTDKERKYIKQLVHRIEKELLTRTIR